MKKSLSIIALAALAFVGCSKVSPGAPNTNEPDQPIKFQAATYKNSTKAEDPHGHLEMPVSQFFVTAFYTGSKGWNETNLSDAVKYMSNVAVSETDGKWKPISDYYWPKTGKLSFIGWCPGQPYVDPFFNQDNKAEFMKISNYQVNYGDLLISDITIDKTVANAQDNFHVTEGVPMLFHHALAKINFSAKLKANGATDNINHFAFIKSVSIKQIYEKGTFTFDASQMATLNGSWATGPDPAVDKDELYKNTAVTQEVGDIFSGTSLGTSEALDLLDNAMLVLPQTLSDNAVVELSYVIYYCNHTTGGYKILDVHEVNNQPFKLNSFKKAGTSTAIDKWEQNKVYNYTIIVDPNSSSIITFDPAVVDWDSPTEAEGAF